MLSCTQRDLEHRDGSGAVLDARHGARDAGRFAGRPTGRLSERAIGRLPAQHQCLRSAELDALLRADFAQDTLVDQQFIARADVDRLLDWLPALRSAASLDRITPRALYSYITVESLVLPIERRMAE